MLFRSRLNPALVDLAGLSGSGTGVTEVKKVEVRENHALTSLTGLENIDTVHVEMTIDNNDGLTDATALDGIQNVYGSFSMEDNASLTDLPDMPSLTAITTTLDLDNNGTTGSHLITDMGFTAISSVPNLYVNGCFIDTASYADNNAVLSWCSAWTVTNRLIGTQSANQFE